MAILGVGGTQPRHVSLVDDCTVEDVSAGGKVEVVCRIVLEAEGFEGRELVDGREDGLLLERLDGDISIGRSGYRGHGGLRRRRRRY